MPITPTAKRLHPATSSLSDHYHSPLTPDHQHETPQLTAALMLATSPMLSIRVDALRLLCSPPADILDRASTPSFVRILTLAALRPSISAT